MSDSPIRQFDTRALEMRLRDGSVSEKDYRQFLKNLPDLEGRCDEVTIPPPGPRGRERAHSGTKS